jgi:High potential iron-sulfur protein
MDESFTESKARRSLMKKAAVFITGIAAMPLLETIRNARAEGKLAKADVKYQDKPGAGKDCDDCLHFIPGATADANGTCKVVEGVISAHGYCAAFTRKPKSGGYPKAG